MLVSYRVREYEALFAYRSHSYISLCSYLVDNLLNSLFRTPQRILFDSLVVGGSSCYQLPVQYY